MQKPARKTEFEILQDVKDLLIDWLDGEEPRFDTQLMLNEIAERWRRKGNPGVPKKPHITVAYENAKGLIAQGARIGDACIKSGITRDQFCRRRRMEQQGRDRKERREY